MMSVDHLPPPSTVSSCDEGGGSSSSSTMDVERTSTASSSIPVTTKYAHPSSTNMFNGNSLTDEELVYQVDYLATCPPADFVM